MEQDEGNRMERTCELPSQNVAERNFDDDSGKCDTLLVDARLENNQVARNEALKKNEFYENIEKMDKYFQDAFVVPKEDEPDGNSEPNNHLFLDNQSKVNDILPYVASKPKLSPNPLASIAKIVSIKEMFGKCLNEAKSIVNCEQKQILEEKFETSLYLDFFKTMHRSEMAFVNSVPDTHWKEKLETKVQFLQEYVEQLEEQNDNFVVTLEELEKEATKRVKLMQLKLASTAKTTMEAVVNFNKCATEVEKLVKEKAYMETLCSKVHKDLLAVKEENIILQDQNFNLSHDLQALVHVIHHARSTGNWELNCVTFCVVTPEQVFGPVQSISQADPGESLQPNFSPDENFKKVKSNAILKEVPKPRLSSKVRNQVENSVQCDGGLNFISLHEKLIQKGKIIRLLESDIAELEHQLILKENECDEYLYELHLQSPRNHGKSSLMSKEVSNTSLPSQIVNPIEVSLSHDDHLKSLHAQFKEKDQQIRLLQSHRSELRQQLLFKENECDDFLYELHLKCKENCKENVKSSLFLQPHETALQSCISLPEIGNIYSYTNVTRKSYSCNCASTVLDAFPSFSPSRNTSKKMNKISQSTGSKSPVCRHLMSNIKIHKAHSEPHLFMYGDNLYVYRPCEPIKRASNVALNDLQLSLPPCQSIDLKFPTESSSTKLFDWMHTNSCGIPSKSVRKAQDHCSVCSSNSTGALNYSTEFLSITDGCSRNKVEAHYHKKDCIHNSYGNVVNNADKSCNSYIQVSKKQPEIYSCFVQTEENVKFSVGVQADLDHDYVSDDFIELGMTEMNLFEMKKAMQVLKNNATKAENKVEEKCILIETLQNHLECALREVNEKDQIINKMDEEIKMLQDHKRSLLTQLDTQGDKVQDAQSQIVSLNQKLKECNVQIQGQLQHISNLEQALVKAKRAYDAVYQQLNTRATNAPFSRNSIVEI